MKQQHGQLLGYQIDYMVEGSGVGHNVTVGPDQLKHTIKGLEYARYSVRVAGYTAAGVGKFTAALQLVPDEGGQYSIKTSIILLVTT